MKKVEAPKKRLKRMLKSFTIKQLEDFRTYPNVFTDIFEEQGLEPPSLDDITKCIDKELNWRLIGEIKHTFKMKIIKILNSKRG